jgi:transposase
VNGLKRDIQAVRNAIIYEYNNGLVEGSVNKLKVIKRIMYGRNKFEMLS